MVWWKSPGGPPATVNVTAPGGMLARVLTVRLAVPSGAGLGEKLQAAPLGKPVQDRLTKPLKLPRPATETEYAAEPPADTDCEAGETLSVKSATVKFTVAERVTAPLAAFTVTGKLPPGVADAALRSRATVPKGAGLGKKLQFAPAGKPPHERLKDPLKPAAALGGTAVIETCELAVVVPGVTNCEAGETATVKSTMLRLMLTEWVSEPAVPTTAIVPPNAESGGPEITVTVAFPTGAGLGEKVQALPAGRPLQVKLTTSAKVPEGRTVTV